MKRKPKPLPKARISNELMRFQGPSEAIVEALRHVGGVSEKTAKAVLVSYPSGKGLANASINALMHLGATEKQARQIHYAFKLTTFCDESCQAMADSKVDGPGAAARFVRVMLGRREQESFGVLILSTASSVIEVLIVATGSLTEVQVHPREVFREAVRMAANSIILFHNHPSGKLEPSHADIALTEKMISVGEKVGIPVLDHVIVGAGGFTSMRASGVVHFSA
jgi:DNA repair protein RadC